MADNMDVSELVRRTLDANARFYQGWVNLSLEYFRGISQIFSGAQEALSGTAPFEETAGAVVLEAEEGATAAGAFLVTNDLGRTLSCEIVATAFQDANGKDAQARITFEPAKFKLEPGEQRVVNAAVPMGAKLAAGVAYSGSFGIKGMEGFAVPAVLRRRHGVDASPIDQVAAPDDPKVKQAGRGTTTAGKAPAPKATARKTASGKKAPARKSTARKSSRGSGKKPAS